MIKVEKQLPVVSALDPQARRQVQGEAQTAAAGARKTARQSSESSAAQPRGKSGSFNLQLNQQLTSMQSAEAYLDDLSARLSQLKLTLGRELSNAQVSERESLKKEIRQLNQLLDERSKRSGQALDSSMKLRLHEPVRSRFTLEGLDSLAAVQEAGRETLFFTAGRKLAEPLTVVLDEGLNDQQILRRFNVGLSPAGIRAELESNGALKFTAREGQWQEIKDELRVKGEGKLAPATLTPVRSEEEQLVKLPDSARMDAPRELRAALNEVVAALDKISAVRDQLRHRQEEIREFLARNEVKDEREWARRFAGDVFSLMQRSPNSYAAVTQTVVAQANISRSTVVSLLS